MSEIYITSDTHFSHKKSFLWEPRGFTCVKDMNEAIVENWNKIVKQDDKVYHLGDIALSDIDDALIYIKQLKGQIIWLRGNHDTDNKIKTIVSACPNINMLCYTDWNASWSTVIKDGKWRFYLSHYPTKVANYDDETKSKLWCLCGHTHTPDKWKDIEDSCYHVEMDAHTCCPVNLETIKNDIRNYKSNI